MATIEQDLKKAYKITAPGCWAKQHCAYFRDGVGYLTVQSVRLEHPGWLALNPATGELTRTTYFSLDEIAAQHERWGASIEAIDLDQALALDQAARSDPEARLRAEDRHERADMLFTPRVVVDPVGRILHVPLQVRSAPDWPLLAEAIRAVEMPYGFNRQENWRALGFNPLEEFHVPPPVDEAELSEEDKERRAQGKLSAAEMREMQAALERAARFMQYAGESVPGQDLPPHEADDAGEQTG
jgi:hypothetical protein